MWIALTREVSADLAHGERTFVPRAPIDLDRARGQHLAFRDALTASGVTVLHLPELPGHADAVFVEDAVVVLDEIAVLTAPGVESRRGERSSLANALCRYREVHMIRNEAALDGGDVLRVGRRLYVGRSRRSDKLGKTLLGDLVRPLGYKLKKVRVDHSLHLKTACAALDAETVLLDPERLDAQAFKAVEVVEIAPGEPDGANVLSLPDRVLVPASAPRTAERLANAGYAVQPVDVSEFAKAEGGLSCLAVVFDAKS